MLARVATRGTRIRAVRGAMNALALLSLVGVSALGASAAIDALADADGTEVETVALRPEPIDRTGSVPASVGGSEASSAPGSTGISDPETPGSTGISDPETPGTTDTVDTTEAPGAPRGSGSGTTPAGTPGPTTGDVDPGPGGPTTTTTATTTTTTTAVPAPQVSNLRMKVSGDVPMGLSVCENEPSSVLAVEISGAERVVMRWSHAGETQAREMVQGSDEWSAPLGDLEEQVGGHPVEVTVEATGPGGTTETSAQLSVEDCTLPEQSLPSTADPEG